MNQFNKSILITGCSSGIGYHCAQALQNRGWQVFATVRREEDLEKLEKLGIETLQMDYSKSETIAACAKSVLAATNGNLYALFNNGAYGQLGAIEDIPTQALRAQFEANLFGWHDLTRRLIPAMRQQGHGRIVQCSSILGFISMKYRGAYNASKHALEALSDTLRMELSDTDIYVSLIEPGPIASRFVENAMAQFKITIEWENSHHTRIYKKRIERMKKGGATRFKLGPEAVEKRLIHALESRKPRPRYYVTTPTYVMSALKRILSHRALDRFLIAQADREV